MTPDEPAAGPEPEPKKKRTVSQKCPVCGHEAWRIAYGMVLPSARQTMPKTEFAGCVVMEEMRVYPSTGKVEFGLPKWVCQNPECRHRWW